MYLDHFGLREAPFLITPHADFFFGGANRSALLDALVYALGREEGLVKVSGEVGTGKTMLCRMLEDSMPDTVETIYLANPSVEPGEILHAIAFELHLDIAHQAPRLQVMQVLQDYLLKRHEEGKQVVLFVEEAQAMPLATLEEIRLLSNLETQHHKLLQIVLFGQPELDEHLADPAIRQLRERVVHSFHLDPLNSTDIRAYLNFRMRQAGYKGPDVFNQTAVREIARASLGLTRRINIIADKALLVAYTERTHNVSAKHVLAAAKDSDFIDFTFLDGRNSWSAGKGLAAAGLVMLGVAIGFAAARWSGPESRAVAQVPATPAPAAAAPARPSVPAGPPPSLSVIRLSATDQWLESSAPDTVSIHILLMGAAEPEKLDNYLEEVSKLVEIEKVFVYRTKAGGKPAWSVLYGSFPDRAAANQALSQLPARIKAQHPYLRTVQGVRAETESATESAR